MNALARTTALAVAVAAPALFLGACREEPDLAKQHRIAGHEALEAARWEEAVKAYARSLEADPNQESVWEKKAYAEMKAGRLDDAAASLTKAIALRQDPAKKAEGYRNIGGMYLQSSTPLKAEQYFLEAIKLQPNDEQALNWLAELHSQLGGARSMEATVDTGHLDQAIAFYDRAIQANPDGVNAWLNKRIALTRYLGHLEKERQAAEEAAAALKKGRDAAGAAAASERAAALQTKYEVMKKLLDETNAGFTAASKRAAAATAK